MSYFWSLAPIFFTHMNSSNQYLNHGVCHNKLCYRLLHHGKPPVGFVLVISKWSIMSFMGQVVGTVRVRSLHCYETVHICIKVKLVSEHFLCLSHLCYIFNSSMVLSIMGCRKKHLQAVINRSFRIQISYTGYFIQETKYHFKCSTDALPFVTKNNSCQFL